MSWPTTTFRDVTLRTRTWNPDKEIRSSIHYVDVSAVSRDKLQIVSPAHLTHNIPSRARKIVESGDTIFATVRPTLHRVSKVPAELDGEIASTAFCVLRPNPAVIDPDFLFFAAISDQVLNEVAGLQSGASYPAVRDADVLDCTIPLPPMDEQKGIAAALTICRRALLDQLEALRLLDELKRATMRELFTRGMRGEAQKDSEIGPIPESWKVARIGDVATRTQYGMSVRGQPSGRYPILRMNCQEDGKVVLRNLQYVDLDAPTYNSFRIERGDILFNRTNSIELVGRTAIFEHNDDAVFASYLVRLTVDQDRCLPRFLNYFMNWPTTQAEIKKLASRAVGQANINASKLRTVAFPLPPTIDEQQEVVAILDAIDGKIDLHKRKKTVLEELFRSLLNKLMTGEIRVADLDLPALEANQKVEA